MMIGSEDSRSPLGRPSSLVPQMTLQRCTRCAAVQCHPRSASRLACQLRVTARLVRTFYLQLFNAAVCPAGQLANLCPAHTTHTHVVSVSAQRA